DRRRPPRRGPSSAHRVAITWVVASWSVWWYGASFGMRALIEAMPVFALGLGALVGTARGTDARARRAGGDGARNGRAARGPGGRGRDQPARGARPDRVLAEDDPARRNHLPP